MVRKVLLSVVSVVAFCSLGFAQNRPVSGVVTNEEGSPVIGVIVTVQGTTTSSITDASGRYTVTAPASGSLEFSSFGLQTQVVAIDSRSVVDVVMAADATLVEDVIVVAYGTANKESFTGSIAVVGSEDIEKRTVSNVTKALAGMAPGVNVLSGSGQPGSGASIQIRGQGSINASSNPLIVVDGAPYNGDLTGLNPNDIASMSILKDASASALYGSRGANGVILITTKKGSSSGRANVNFRAVVGVSSRAIKPYDTLNQDEFVETTYMALKNPYLYGSGYSPANAHIAASNEMSSALGGQHYNPYKNKTWQTLIDPATGKVASDAKSVWNENWLDGITNNKALRQEYSVGINGGNEKTTYAMSVGYLNEQGTLKYTDYERFSGSATVDHKAKHWLNMGINVAYTYSIQNGTQYSSSQTGNPWYTAQFMAPIYPIYQKDAEGNDLLDENGDRILDYGDQPGALRPKGDLFNAVGDLRDNKNEVSSDIVRYGSHITLGSDDPAAGWLQGLKLTANLNGDMTNQMQLLYYNMYHGDAAASKGEITRDNYRYQTYTFNQLLTYNRTFGKHDVNFLAGHEYYSYYMTDLWATRSGLFDGIYELAPGVTLQEGSSYSNRDRIEAYFGRVNYGYDNKYYIDAHFRRDGSSRFHTDYRWGNFWGVGASWRISREEFMKSVSWVDNLTYKISYGSIGNNDLSSGYYAWQSFYNLGNANANNSGAVISSLANPSVSWETIGSFNTGIDATLFDGELRVTAEYYSRKTSDMLLSYPMATSTGFNGYNDNVGDMVNKGFEFSVGATIINTPNFVWDATLMGATNKNKVLKLTETDQIVSGVQVIEVGKPLYTFWMPKSAGVDPATGSQLYWVYDLDENDNIVNERISSDRAKAATSKYYQGKREADFYGSFSSSFVIFKNFDLSFLATYSIGGKIYESVYQSTMTPTYPGDTFNRHILRAWQKPGDVTDIPRAQFNAGYATTDRWLINASYLSINNISFGYTLPSQITDRWNMGRMRVYATMDNVALFTHLQGMNPTYNFSGSTNYAYAPVRTMSLGLDINF